MQKDLQKTRKEIDAVDEKLKKYIEKREKLIKKVKKIKDKLNLKIQDKNREQKILKRMKSPFVKKVFKEILKHSRKAQSDFD
jgi:chorismate mutase